MKREVITKTGAGSKADAHDAAEALAIAALTFLASEPVRLERFVAICGLSPANLRAAAATPGFLAAVLDHLAGDETLLLAFAAAAPCDPAEVGRARECLSPSPP